MKKLNTSTKLREGTKRSGDGKIKTIQEFFGTMNLKMWFAHLIILPSCNVCSHSDGQVKWNEVKE